jgi:hypothetical protein
VFAAQIKIHREDAAISRVIKVLGWLRNRQLESRQITYRIKEDCGIFLYVALSSTSETSELAEAFEGKLINTGEMQGHVQNE